MSTEPGGHDLAWALSEGEAIAAVRVFEGPLIVDLDETLYLRNSTEQFIALAAPNLLAAYLLRVLDIVKPWRFFGGPECRDNWRILLVLALFPWTYRRWLQFCQRSVPGWVNQPLRDALDDVEGRPIYIVSNGYRRLIVPMLPALRLREAELVCCRLLHFGDRSKGKAALARRALGDDTVCRSLVITDSKKDADILALCGRPCLVTWERAQFRRAFQDVAYLPGDYLSRVKRPRTGAFKKLLREDLLVWLGIALSIPGVTIAQMAGVALLFASMWAIYELGYYDNDLVASRFEADPRLTPEFLSFVGNGFHLRAWLAALFFGVPGALAVGNFASPWLAVVWIVVLAALQGTYWVYNRIDKRSRLWLYVVLQAFRSGAFLSLVVAGPVGYAIFNSQIIVRWIDYIIYRNGRSIGQNQYPKTPNRALRLVLLLLLLTPLLLARDWSALLTPALIVLPWFLYLAALYDLRPILRDLHRLDRVPEGRPLSHTAEPSESQELSAPHEREEITAAR